MSGAAMAGKVFVVVHRRDNMDDPPRNPDGLTPQERAGMISTLLQAGAVLTTAEVAERCCMTPNGAWRMLTNLARTLPIYCDAGAWRWLSDSPEVYPE